ncbi:MAG: exodeoxyribonuclease VII large subunit [Oscillospiraceae bacterium]|nr:exodeoxyribonuclease VII large subunit [Oscillospiraceae bacterium]
MQNEQLVLEVSQVNSYIKEMLDADGLLGGLCIRGELSNYKKYPSGHHYFTLKDGQSQLKCVMFRSSAMRLRFRPENGMMVQAAGRITVYPRDGVYQLYCVAMTPEGAGDLAVAFEQLKKKLAAEGLFDPAHKKPIPAYPHQIAIITSAAGAAVHDMLRIIRHRYPLAEVKLLPVRVQGEEAAGEIAAALDYANRYQLADLIITGRGGGSMEDLWAFNEEVVARAIYRSKIPVISAVGHEPDVTIADYVADLRAATPSNAAELCTPDQQELRQKIAAAQTRMASLLSRQLKNCRTQLELRKDARVLQSPENYLADRRQTLDVLTEKLGRTMANRLTKEAGQLALCRQRLSTAENAVLAGERKRLETSAARLDAMSPLKVLSRGYSITENNRGAAIVSASSLHPGDHITIRFHRGSADARVEQVREEQS